MKTNQPTPTTVSKQRLLELQRDFAISVGAVVAVHERELPESVIWQLSRSLSRAFRKQLQRLDDQMPDMDGPLTPHPAILLLLAEIGARSWTETATDGGSADE